MRPSVARERPTLEIRLGLLGLGLIALAVVFAAIGTPALPPAPLVRLGIASPLSGMTRSFVALVDGDVAASFRWHPLGPAVFAACVVAAAVAVATLLRGRRFDGLVRALGRREVLIVVAVGVVAVWVRQIVWLGPG